MVDELNNKMSKLGSEIVGGVTCSIDLRVLILEL